MSFRLPTVSALQGGRKLCLSTCLRGGDRQIAFRASAFLRGKRQPPRSSA